MSFGRSSPSTRQHRRARAQALYVNKIANDTAHLAKVRDISVGGMFLYKLLEPTTAEADTFTVEMQLPGHDNLIWASVEVVRKEERDDDTLGFAVRFARLAEADRRTIGAYVESHPIEPSSHHERRH